MLILFTPLLDDLLTVNRIDPESNAMLNRSGGMEHRPPNLAERFGEVEISVNVLTIKGLVAVPPRYEGNHDKEENKRVNIDATKILFTDRDEILVAGKHADIQERINAYLLGDKV